MGFVIGFFIGAILTYLQFNQIIDENELLRKDNEILEKLNKSYWQELIELRKKC